MIDALELFKKYVEIHNDIDPTLLNNKVKWNINWMQHCIDMTKSEKIDDLGNALFGFFINLDNVSSYSPTINSYSDWYGKKITAIINCLNMEIKRKKIKSLFEFYIRQNVNYIENFENAFKRNTYKHNCLIVIFDTLNMWTLPEAREKIINFQYE